MTLGQARDRIRMRIARQWGDTIGGDEPIKQDVQALCVAVENLERLVEGLDRARAADAEQIRHLRSENRYLVTGEEQ